jgi:hypothetical protein
VIPVGNDGRRVARQLLHLVQNRLILGVFCHGHLTSRITINGGAIQSEASIQFHDRASGQGSLAAQELRECRVVDTQELRKRTQRVLRVPGTVTADARL